MNQPNSVPKNIPINKPATENPKSQNNSFIRSHTIGTRNINIKMIKNIFINLSITIFSFKLFIISSFFYNAKVRLFFHTTKYFTLKNVKYKNFFDNTTQSRNPPSQSYIISMKLNHRTNHPGQLNHRMYRTRTSTILTTF